MAIACGFAACGGRTTVGATTADNADPTRTGQSRAQVYAQVARITEVGRRMFFDPALSGSGKLACASCHDPAHAFAAANDLPVQLGGPDGHQQGMRAAPTLKYLQTVPAFTEHYFGSDNEGDDSIDNGPTGGLTWDGRVDLGAEQARIPLTSSFEMASTPRKIAAAIRRAPYADAFRAAFGANVVDSDEQTFNAALRAFEIFEQSAADFYPYSSKYDAFLAGKATLTEAEMHGLELFNDETKGNCASCHISRRSPDGTPPQFTDYGLIAIGVPRNRTLSVNANPHFYDLGACGPQRTDLTDKPQYCGLFKTPTLRNVALRKSFFHNGVVHSLDDAVRFYVERDTRPQNWYPRDTRGRVQQFDDLPLGYRANVNVEAPFGGQPGDTPALSEAEIRDVVAFLQTLTDNYQTATSAASR